MWCDVLCYVALCDSPCCHAAISHCSPILAPGSASGHQIPNEGEKRFSAVTEEGLEKEMTLQVADVNQGLLSVSKAMKAGNRVVFDEAGSYIESKRTGDKTWMRERNGMFIMKLWVKRPF